MKIYFKLKLILLMLTLLNLTQFAYSKSCQLVICDLTAKSYDQAIDIINESVKPTLRLWQIKTNNNSLANICILNYARPEFIVKAFVNEHTKPVKTVVSDTNALVGINGGYFNLNNGKSASYICAHKQIIANPHDNPDLVNNPKLMPYLTQIFDRSEIRFVQTLDRTYFTICKHSYPLEKNANLLWSLQAGPQLLPDLTLAAEAFVRINSDGTKTDAIGSNVNKPRSAIGLTANQNLILITIAGSSQSPGSVGITLPDLTQIFKDLKCIQALNFDGGTSTTMVAKLNNDNVIDLCTKIPATLIKSGLIIVNNAHY